MRAVAVIDLKRTPLGPIPRRNKKIRVNQLARELGVPNKAVLQLLAANGLRDAVKNHMSVLSEGLAETVRQWLIRRPSGAIETSAAVAASPQRVPNPRSVTLIRQEPKSLLLCWLEQLDSFVEQLQPRIAVTESWSIIEERLTATFLNRHRHFGEGFAKTIVQDCASKSPEIQKLANRIQTLRRLRNRAEHDRFDPPMNEAAAARDLCREIVRICAMYLEKVNAARERNPAAK
jgi:hypothetical protein